MRRRVLACLLVFAIIAAFFPQTAYGAALLKYGSRGTEVKNLQQQLIKLGFLKGKADGIFGSQTQAAVIKFQKAYKLKQDGIVGQATRSKLSEAMSALQKGSNSSPPASKSNQQSRNSSSNNAPITRTLKMGSRGQEVKTLQKRLNQLGFNCGAVDGIFGSKTQSAVIKFQKAKGLTANGVVDSKTVAKLFGTSSSSPPSNNGGSNTGGNNGNGGSNKKDTPPITTTLKKGSRGSQVVILQKRLNQLGFNCGAVDGIFGSKTQSAVIKFQKAKGLTANGVVDSKTVVKLFSSDSSQNPKPEPNPNPGFTQFHGIPGTLSGKTIFIDAGHGGVNGGATKNGVMEKTLVLDMALRLKRILEEAGAKAILTRPDDKFYSLHYRSAFVNSYILKTELSAVNNERNAAVSARDAKQAEVQKKEQEKNQKEADVLKYRTELENKRSYLLQLEAKENELESKVPSAQAEYENKKKAYDEKYLVYKQLEDELLQVKENLADLKSQRDGIQEQLNDILGEGQDVGTLITELQAIIAQLKSQLDEDPENEDLKQQLQEAEAKLGKLVELSDRLNALNTQISEKEGIIDGKEDELKQLADELDLDNLKAAMEQAKAELDGINSELEDVKQDIEEATTAITGLEKMKSDAENAVEQLKSVIDALGKEIEDLGKDIELKDKQIQTINTRISQFQEHIVNYGVHRYTGMYAELKDPKTGKRHATPELKEVMDLTAQKYHNDYLFISIHCNATSAREQTSASGVTVFYRDNGPYSYNGTYGLNVEYYSGYNAQKRERLAQKLLEQLNATTNFSKKYYKPYKADFSVLRENNLISVLVEVGFINNPNDLSLLVKEQTRENAAAGIYKGIVEYYK